MKISENCPNEQGYLSGPQAAQLAQRRLQLTNSKQMIAAYPQKIAAVEGLERALAQRMSPGATYQACVDWLLGTPQQQGRFRMCRHSWSPSHPPVHEVTQERLQALLKEIYHLQSQWQAASGQLVASAGEVSYAKLYEAVLALADGATTCPACGTGLTAVAQDPFAKARAGLEQLAQLAALQ
ncbi:MAG: ATPase involved in DNA repair [uncultured Paraburkholderia sp.]|nr:MAG: ATPase involved in DNA repair [uncultured Paraburkholderia sp.]CAH2945362.1 MAG: ATPase involved in DNA repair [uncultured Paraburkholderia sp.]